MAPATAAVESGAWYELDSHCIFCKKDDYTCGYGPRSMLLCSCCPKGTHVECYEKAKGIVLTQDFIDSGSSWFCSKACEEITAHFEGLPGKRLPIKGESAEYSLEVVKYDKGSKTVKNVVEAAKNIFKSAFDPLVMDNGQDLVTMCCHAYESPDGADEEEEELVDYSAFRVVALRKGSQIVAVATLRVFGDQLAEMPFVATRTGFRRAGHCRRLIKGVEALLRQLCVRWLVLPSIRTVLPMWRYSFSFIPLTLEEQAALEPHIVSPDYESAQLVKKAMWPPPRATGGRRTAGAAAAGGGSKGTARRGSTRGRGRNSSSRPTRGNSRRSASRASSGAANSRDDSDSDAANAAREQGPGLFRFKGRKTRAAAAVAAAAGSGDSSSSSSEDEGDAADVAAGGSQEDEEAAAAWAMWEAAGGKMGSQDKDSDFDAESSSSSDDSNSDSDVDLVSEGEDGVKKGADKTAKAAQKAKQQKQDGQDAGDAEGGKGSEMEAAEAAALEVLRKEVSKAGGVLPEGWNVRLGNRQPTGYYKEKTYTEPGSGKTFKSVPAVKRHLGLAAPLRTGSRRGGSPDPDDPAAAAAGGPAAREGWRRGSTPDQTGACGSYGSLDPAQQLAQVKLLRARAVAGQQMRLRVMRARRELVAQARLAAILAESLRTFYDTTKDALASTPADGQPSWLQLQAQSAVAQQRSARHAQAQQQQQQLVDPKANHSAADNCGPTTLALQHIGSVQQQQREQDELTLLRSQLAERDAELSQLKKQQGQLLIQATFQQQLLQHSKTQIAQLQAQLLDAQARLVQQTPGVLAGAFAAADGAAVTATTVSAASEAAARAARRCSTPTLAAAAAAEGKTVGLQAGAGRQQQGQPADADAVDMMASDPYLEVDAQMCSDDPMPDMGEGMGGEPAGQEEPATAEAGATAAAEAATAAEQADDVMSDGPVPHVGRDATDLAEPAPQPESLGDPVSVAAVANSALPAAAVPAALKDPAGAATAATAAAKTAETAAAAASEQADEAAFAAAAADDDAGDTAALRAAAVAALTAYTPTKAAAAAATGRRSPAAACSTRAATNSSSKVHKAAAGSNAADAGGSDVEPAAAQLLPSSPPAAAAAPAAAVAATLPDPSPVNAEQHIASPHTADPTGTHNSALALNQTSPPAAATTVVAPPAAATAVAAGVHHACPNTPAQSPAPSAAAAASGVAPAADTVSGPAAAAAAAAAAVGSAASAAELLEVLAVLTAPQKGSTPAGASDTTVAPDILTTGGKPALLTAAPLASESQQQQLPAQPAGRAAPPAAPSAPVRTSPDCAGSLPAAAGVPAATNTGATGLLTDPAAVSASLGNHPATSSVGAADAAFAAAPAAEPTVVAVPAAGTSEVSEAAAAGGGSAAAPAPAAFGDGAERLNSNSKASPARPDASTMPAAADTAAAAACATPAAASLSTDRLLHSSRASPKVSDSFLSGLLPYVVGQLMTTPRSAATTAKTPAAAVAAAVTGATAEPAQRRLSLSLTAVPCALGQVAVHTPESAAAEGATAAVGMHDSLAAGVAHETQPAAAGAVAVDSPTVVAGRAAAAAADIVAVETSSAQTGSCSPPSPPSISLTATAASKLTQGSVSAAAAAAAAAAGLRVSSSMPSTGVADPAAASGTSKRPRSAWVSSTEYKQQARTLAASSLSQCTAAGMCQADAVPVFSPTPSGNKSAAAPVATPSDPHHQQQQQHNTAEEGKENLQVPAARPAKKRKVQSAVLAWFGDIADMDENSNERGPDEAECTVSISDLGPGSGGTAVGGDLDSGPGSGGSGGSGGRDGSGGSSGIRDPGSDAALLRALQGDRRFGSAGKGAGGAATAAAAGRTPAAAAVTAARGGSGGCGGRGMQQPGSMLAAAAAVSGGGRAGARAQGVSAQKQGVLGQVQQGTGTTGTAAAGAAAGGGGRSSDGGTRRGGVLGGGSRKGSGGLEAQLAAAADAAGVEACDVDMDAEICAAMDTAALFAYAGDV